MVKGYYKCECGKEFDNPQRFNGHKQGCEIHIVKKYGSLDAYYKIKNRNHDKSCKTRRKKRTEKKMRDLQDWISEQHACEKCGKVMTEKFGSGRFCSRACSNSRIRSEETKDKIRKSIINKLSATQNDTNYRKINEVEFAYLANPKICKVCGNALSYIKRFNKTCSRPCTLKLQSEKMFDIYKQKGLHRTSIKTYKYGTYKGIECDSSWELVFIMYMLDHNKTVYRNKQGFEYTYKDKQHLYYPDFIIDGVFYEIKNFYTDQVDAKISQFPKDLKLVLIGKTLIKPYLSYAKAAYGKDFCELYDKDKKAWNNNL